MAWRQPHWLIGGPLPEELAKTEQYIGQVAAVMEDMTTQEISHHYQITVGFVLHVLEQIAKLKTVEFEKQFRAPTRPLTAEEIAELTKPRDRTMDTVEVKPLRQHCPPMSDADLRFIIENDLLSFPEACKQIGFTQCALSQQMKKGHIEPALYAGGKRYFHREDLEALKERVERYHRKYTDVK